MNWKPLWIHFFCFYRFFSLIIWYWIDIYNLIPIFFSLKNKLYSSMKGKLILCNDNSTFFSNFTYRRGFNSFVWFFFSSEAIPFSHSKSTLLHTEENLSLFIQWKYKGTLFHKIIWLLVNSYSSLHHYQFVNFEFMRKKNCYFLEKWDIQKKKEGYYHLCDID